MSGAHFFNFLFEFGGLWLIFLVILLAGDETPGVRLNFDDGRLVLLTDLISLGHLCCGCEMCLALVAHFDPLTEVLGVRIFWCVVAAGLAHLSTFAVTFDF